MSRAYFRYFSGLAWNSCSCSLESAEVSWKGARQKGSVRNRCLQLKFVPPGPANLAPKPVVIQTGDLRNGISFSTTVVQNQLSGYPKPGGVDPLLTGLNRRHYLNGRRASTNHGYSLAFQVVLRIPSCAVHKLSLVLIQSWNFWVLP
jgi:hypothetical protein